MQLLARFDAAILTNPQEDDAVDGHPDGEIQFALVLDGWVAYGEITRKQVAPALNLGQEGIINFRGAFVTSHAFGKLVKRAFKNSCMGKDGGNLIPFFNIFRIMVQAYPSQRRLVRFYGTVVTVINSQLLEIGEEADG